MAARYGADDGDEAKQDETEREARQQDSGGNAAAEGPEAEGDGRHARAEEHQQRGADQFRCVLARHVRIDHYGSRSGL